jgi:hypothetical protein
MRLRIEITENDKQVSYVSVYPEGFKGSEANAKKKAGPKKSESSICINKSAAHVSDDSPGPVANCPLYIADWLFRCDMIPK